MTADCSCDPEGRWDNPDCARHGFGSVADEDTASALHGYEVDWATIWTADLGAGDWVLEPVIPGGAKATHLYSPRGGGKTNLSLAMAAGLATGRAILDRPAGPPMRVGYVDAEMSKVELREYLEELGYGPTTNLDNLRYLVDCPIPPLDVVEGGLEIVSWLAGVGAEIVFVDSITSVLRGEENSNDAYQQLFNYTIGPIKRLGIPSVWTGNSGKDREKGSRGGSRKEDLMDCIWRLERNDGDAMTLTNTKKRSAAIPDKVQLLRRTAGNGTIEYVIPAEGMDDLPVGSMECAKLLDGLGLPLDVSYRTAARTLKENGSGRRNDVVRGALKYRRWADAKSARSIGAHPGAHLPGAPSGRTGAHPSETPADQPKQAGRTNGAHLGSQRGALTPSIGGGAPQGPGAQPSLDDWDPLEGTKR